jgi:hypothetical protein
MAYKQKRQRIRQGVNFNRIDLILTAYAKRKITKKDATRLINKYGFGRK